MPPDFAAVGYWGPRLARELGSGGFEWLLPSRVVVPFVLDALKASEHQTAGVAESRDAQRPDYVGKPHNHLTDETATLPRPSSSDTAPLGESTTGPDIAAAATITAGGQGLGPGPADTYHPHCKSLVNLSTATPTNNTTPTSSDFPVNVDPEIPTLISHTDPLSPNFDLPTVTSSPPRRLRVLHLGCGSSDLGTTLARALVEAGWGVDVVDADYVDLDAVQAVQGDVEEGNEESEIEGERPNTFEESGSEGLVASQDGRTGTVIRRIMDVLSLPSVLSASTTPTSTTSQARPGHTSDVTLEVGRIWWDLIIDKSTADAISCGPDVNVDILHNHTENDDLGTSRTTQLEPLDATLFHLAHVTRPGSVWACVSYSASRFDHLPRLSTTRPRSTMGSGGFSISEPHLRLGPGPGPHWAVVSRRLLLRTGEGKAYEPETGVWGWVLRRI